MRTAVSVQRFAKRQFVTSLLARPLLVTLLLLGLPFGAASAAGERGSGPAVGDVVGRLGLDAPPLDSFIVHGTLPVPPGVHPRADGLSPFQLRDGSGVLSPAQVEIVSRYPSRVGVQDQADVVELIARVARPPGAAAGDPITYDVVFSPHATAGFQANPAVADLLARPGNIRLRTSDVFGNGYRAEPLRNLSNGWYRRVLKSGELVLQETTHQSLKPTFHAQGPTATLPHLMGVHTYLTQWADEEFVSLDLRVHNQHCGRLPDDPNDDALGGLYFRSLELRLPQGWQLVSAYPDPFFGAPYDEGDHRVWPIVAPLADGTLHFMPPMAQFHRRFVIARDGQPADHVARARAVLREETLAFCRPGTAAGGRVLDSWWNPTTARYFPQNHVLPALDHLNLAVLRQGIEDESRLREDTLLGLAQPSWPIVSPRLGWAHPWGLTDSGVAGGLEIYLYDGLETAWIGSQAGYRLAQITHRMYSERQRNVLYDRNGLPSQFEDWLVSSPIGPIFPIWWHNGPLLWAADPFGITTSPVFQRQAVTALGLEPAYEVALQAFDSIDIGHLVRYTRSPKVLIWLGNDALAKDDMRAQAEAVLFTLTRLPQEADGSTISTGLLELQRYVASFPGTGLPFGREGGWMLDAMTTAYATLGPRWRQRTFDWFTDLTDVIETGQSECTGIIQHSPMGNIFGAQYRNRQSIECAIADNAIWSMMTTVYGDAQPALRERCAEVLRRSSYSMISTPVWSHELNAPWAMIAVGPYDLEQPPFCDYWPVDANYGIADTYQPWSSFAYGYELSGDPIFLTRAQQMVGQPLALGLSAAGLDNIQNRAALLALVQALN